MTILVTISAVPVRHPAERAAIRHGDGEGLAGARHARHPVIQAVQQHEYEGFVEAELQQRIALNYPPHGRLILLRLSSVEASAVENTAQAIASYLNDYVTPSWEILGPAPANILRVANRYRWQILLKIAPDLQPVLPDWQQVRSLCPNNVSLTIDVDPLNLM